MKTEKTVGDEKQKITDEQIGKLQRKTNEIIRRINEGTISYDDALAGMQGIIEGKTKRLRLDLIPQKKWWEENGVIYFNVMSDGATREQWVKRLKKCGIKLSKYAKELLLSKEFKSTFGVEYTVAVLKSYLKPGSLAVKEIHNKAVKEKLITPNHEAILLVREMLSTEDIRSMGFNWIVMFQDPIENFCINSGHDGFFLLGANCGSNIPLLDASSDFTVIGWDGIDGFAFEISRSHPLNNVE